MPLKIELAYSNLEPTIAQAIILVVSDSRKGEYDGHVHIENCPQHAFYNNLPTVL